MKFEKGQLVKAYNQKAKGWFLGNVVDVEGNLVTIKPTSKISGSWFMDYIVKERIHTMVSAKNVMAAE